MDFGALGGTHASDPAFAASVNRPAANKDKLLKRSILMFRLIGMVVVAFVLYVGYNSFNAWYKGDVSPEKTVQEVRQKLGDVITPHPANPVPSSPASTPAK